MGKPILCIDFDGVIHSYSSGWKGVDVIPDPPVPGALRWIWKATKWFDAHVYSSRSKVPSGRAAMDAYWRVECKKEFGPDHPAAACVTFSPEKPAAFLTIDDRALCFEGKWDFEPADLLGFKPWNKRDSIPTARCLACCDVDGPDEQGECCQVCGRIIGAERDRASTMSVRP